MDDSFTDSGTAFAIVSPCSQCLNQLSEVDVTGKPFCPRRKWQADQAEYQTANKGNLDPRLVPLTAYGTEGTPSAGNLALKNPVYLSDSKVTLVWIATLRDNAGVVDGSGNVVAPSILDPSFIPAHTDQIHCRPLPFVPAQHEAAYRQAGALKEGDTVFASMVQNQQFDVAATVEDSEPSSNQAVLIDGVVNKVNLVYFTPRTPVEVDHVVQGS